MPLKATVLGLRDSSHRQSLRNADLFPERQMGADVSTDCEHRTIQGVPLAPISGRLVRGLWWKGIHRRPRTPTVHRELGAKLHRGVEAPDNFGSSETLRGRHRRGHFRACSHPHPCRVPLATSSPSLLATYHCVADGFHRSFVQPRIGHILVCRQDSGASTTVKSAAVILYRATGNSSRPS